jgi:hypothetical protein
MRVQRGYTSDSEAARDQADFIENLKCDVVALAFRRFLEEAKLEFILGKLTTQNASSKIWDLNALPLPAVDTAAEEWQTVLYFLIHLVPVDEIGQLLHQIRKWAILTGKTPAHRSQAQLHEGAALGRVPQVQKVLELYLDMHDAKFEGGATLIRNAISASPKITIAITARSGR